MPRLTPPSTPEFIPALKDESRERPVPTQWRPYFSKIVDAFVAKDYGISEPIPGVSPVPEEIASQIAEYVEDYGEVLTSLTEDTWHSSVTIWMGAYWETLIDLRTESEGRSDLVLHARVTEVRGEPLIEVGLVYVP